MRADAFDDRRCAEVGQLCARRDHQRRRPADVETQRWWAPAFRDAYNEERARLGYCADEGHDWQPERVTNETPAVIRQLRPLGAWIEVCDRCGVFRDRRLDDDEG